MTAATRSGCITKNGEKIGKEAKEICSETLANKKSFPKVNFLVAHAKLYDRITVRYNALAEKGEK